MNITFTQSFSSTKVNKKPNIVSLTSFKGLNKDSFKTSSIELLEGKLTPALERTINQIETTTENCHLLGAGADGLVYKADGTKEFPLGIAIKASHTEPKNAKGQMQRVGVKFEDELEILTALPESLKNTQKLVAYLKTGENKYYLLTSFVSGKNPDAVKNPFTTSHIKSLQDALLKLDTAGILHRDLKKDNILFTQTGPANLIDYGASVKYSCLNPEENNKTHNFPVFYAPSNLRNFEDTCLFPYLQKLSETGNDGNAKARSIFTDHLRFRADFHQKKAAFIENELKTKGSSLDKEAKSSVKKAIKYEQLQAKVFDVLNNVTPKNQELANDIINLEAMKIQTTYSGEEAYRNEILENNPIANLSWKTYAGISTRRFSEKIDTLQEKYANSGNKELLELLDMHKEYAEFKTEQNFHPWTKGAFDWIWDNILRKHDGQDYSKDIISQLSNDKVLTAPLKLNNVAAIIEQGNVIGEVANVA